MSVIQRNFVLTAYNTLRLSAHCAAYSKVTQLSDFPALIDLAQQESLQLIPLGEGSNVVLSELPNILIADIQLKGISILEENAECIRLKVMAGENWHDFVCLCVARGWYGLENLALIPGRVGAAPVQNIGAYGVDVSHVIDCVIGINVNQSHVVSTGYELEDVFLTNEQCCFDYRDSIFKHELCDKFIITAVELSLSKQDKPKFDYPALQTYFSSIQLPISAQQVLNAVVEIRNSKLPDPALLPNAGSFFKNPILNTNDFERFKSKYPNAPWFNVESQDLSDANQNQQKYKIAAGWLIEQCGFKGLKQGALAMHDKQALVLTHSISTSQERANAEQVYDFANQIIKAVKHHFNIVLDIEPRGY